MAQYEVLSWSFNPTGSGEELQVNIDNPEAKSLLSTNHEVPEGVELVPTGGSPTQELWVWEENYHLTIILEDGSGADPLAVTDTEYYEADQNGRFVDVIVVFRDGNDDDPKNVRRKTVVVHK